MNKYTSRKFILALLSLITSTGLVICGSIPPSDYRIIFLGTVGIYIAGNVYQNTKGVAA